RPRVESLTAGDPLKEGIRMGPMIRERDAARVSQWVEQAVAQGAPLVPRGPLAAGAPLKEGIRMAPMIRERDAARVSQWVDQAVAQGARLVTGGQRQGTLARPTLRADVRPDMRVSCDELFGPAVGVPAAANIDEAIALANDSRYGLSAGIFTQDIDSALAFARRVDAGNLPINWGPP